MAEQRRHDHVGHMAQGDEPVISIVVLTYNNPAILSRCLESALRLSDVAAEVIVVDNASTDDTVERVRRDFPSVEVVAQPVNSPVVARNAGYRRARGRYILSLDHDMIIPDHRFLARAVELFEAFPEAGVLSAKICSEDAPTSAIEGHWWYPTPISEQHRFFWTSYFAEGAVLFRTDAVRAAGGYDERFFHTAENIDLAYKILDLDWQILYCPSLVTIELVVSGHLSQRRSMSNELSLRNRLWVAWKHYALPKAIAFAAPRIAAAAVRSVRYRWFDYFLKGVWSGVFAPADVRRDRRPISASRWAAIEAIEGVEVNPPDR